MISLPIVFPRKIRDSSNPILLIQPPSLNNTNPNHIIFNILNIVYQHYLRLEYFRLLFLPLLRLDTNNKSLPTVEEKNILKFWLYDTKPIIKLSSVYQSHNKFGWYNCVKGEKNIIYLSADLLAKTESILQNNPEQAQFYIFAIFSSYLHELANYFASNISGLYIYSPHQPDIFNTNGYWLENILYRGKILYQVFEDNKIEVNKNKKKYYYLFLISHFFIDRKSRS